MHAAQSKLSIYCPCTQKLRTEQTIHQRTIIHGIMNNCIRGRICQYQRLTVVAAGSDTGSPKRQAIT